MVNLDYYGMNDRDVPKVSFDSITKPEHYNSGKIEFIDWLEQGVSDDEYKGFLKGNIYKYLFRYQHKGGIEDLEKAKTYLVMLIKKEEK